MRFPSQFEVGCHRVRSVRITVHSPVSRTVNSVNGLRSPTRLPSRDSVTRIGPNCLSKLRRATIPSAPARNTCLLFTRSQWSIDLWRFQRRRSYPIKSHLNRRLQKPACLGYTNGCADPQPMRRDRSLLKAFPTVWAAAGLMDGWLIKPLPPWVQADLVGSNRRHPTTGIEIAKGSNLRPVD